MPSPPRHQVWVGARSTTVVDMKFHDITMTSITGDQVTFDDFKGKLVLVVNVASA